MIEQRLQAHVGPVRDQLAYISEAVAKGEIDFDDHEQWRTFALGTLAAAPQAVGFVVIPVNGEPVRFTRAASDDYDNGKHSRAGIKARHEKRSEQQQADA